MFEGTDFNVAKFLDTDTDTDSDNDDKIQGPKNINSEKCNEIVEMQIN